MFSVGLAFFWFVCYVRYYKMVEIIIICFNFFILDEDGRCRSVLSSDSCVWVVELCVKKLGFLLIVRYVYKER